MRLKLVIAASVLAAIVGAGICIALVLGVFSMKALSSPSLLVSSTLLLPIATISFASIFVYRHTARRRKLQAFLTAIIAILLTLAFFIAAANKNRYSDGKARPLTALWFGILALQSDPSVHEITLSVAP